MTFVVLGCLLAAVSAYVLFPYIGSAVLIVAALVTLLGAYVQVAWCNRNK